MNKKVNVKREAYAKKQEEKGKKVIMGIIACLIILAFAYMIFASGVVA